MRPTERTGYSTLLTLATASFLLGPVGVPSQAQLTTRLSESPAGVGGGEDSYEPRVSGDGSVAVFTSDARNLGDTVLPEFTTLNIYRWDAGSGLTAVTSFALGDPGWGPSTRPVVSEDGVWIACQSGAQLDGPKLGSTDIYVTQTGGTFVRITEQVWGFPSGTGASTDPVISADGRHVAFENNTKHLVPEGVDVNGGTDVFVVDRDPDGNGVFDEGNALTTLVSATPAGFSGNAGSRRCTISGSGRRIVFESEATDLGPVPVGGPGRYYVLDRDPDGNGDFYDVPGVITQVNLDATGASLGSVWSQEISSDGSAIALSLSDGQIYVKDLTTGAVERVSESSLGQVGSNQSTWCSISADGSRVAFRSLATNLVWDNSPTFGHTQVYLHDRTTGQTTRLSVDSAGHPADSYTGKPVGELSPLDLSGDGSTVVFTSFGQNLVPVDSNGVPDVFRHAIGGNPTTDRGLATAGGGGQFPAFTIVGALGGGEFAEARLRNAAPGATAILQAGLVPAPTPIGACGAVLAMPFPAPITLLFPVDPLGDITFGFPGGGGPIDLFAQWAVLDPLATCGFGLSNVLQIHFQP